MVWVIIIPGRGRRAGGLVGPFPSEARARAYVVDRRYVECQVMPMVWLVDSAWVGVPAERVGVDVL
jgi:hypothetical protein